MLTVLARASIDGAVFAAAIWILVRLLRSLSPGAKAFLWWCAALKFLVALIWTTPVPLPLLPARPQPAVVTAGGSSDQSAAITTRAARLLVPGTMPRRSDALLVLWMSGALLSIGLGWRRWRHVRRAIAASSAAPAEIREMAADIASRIHLSRIPDVRLCDAIHTPLVAGLRGPAVLLPTDRFERLGPRGQRMALCHELAHVKRADVWFGAAAALAERLFFFHPVAHLAAREYVFWREAACDRVVVQTLDAAPHDYGRLLLDLGIAAPRRTLAAAGAAWSFSNLERRIVMLGHPTSVSAASRMLAAIALTLAAAGVVPMTLAARQSGEPVASGQARDQPPAVRDVAREALTFVLFTEDGNTTMSGSTGDIARARRFRHGREPMLWFRSHGVEYIVTDQKVVQDVRAVWQVVGVIGAQQGLLGARQGVLGQRQAQSGAQQAEIGRLQAEIGAQQGAIGTRQAQLAARETSLRTDAQRTDFERETRALEARMIDLSHRMAELDPKMKELDQAMEKLNAQMNELGAEMDALTRRMDDASKAAEADMRALVDRAIATGVAKIVR